MTTQVTVDFATGIRRTVGRISDPGQVAVTSVLVSPGDVIVDSGAAAVSAVPDTPSPPIVTEEFPDAGVVDRFFTATVTQSQLDAIQTGEIVEFAAGSYGDKNLNNLPSNVYAFCRATQGPNGDFNHKWTGTPAFFQHVHDGVCYDHPFAWDMGAASVLRGLRIRGFSPLPKSGTDHRGSGVVRPASGAVDAVVMDCEISHTRESAIMPTGQRFTGKRVALHHLGRYGWGAQVGDDFTIDQVWGYEIATDTTASLGLVPEQPTSDEGLCKMSGPERATVTGVRMWDISGMGVWWDGAGIDGVVRDVMARNVDRNVVNFEICFGPMLAEDIYAEDSANASADGVDVIRAVVLWPLTPDVTVREVVAVRCGNGVCTTNRYHARFDGGSSLGYSQEEWRQRLGVENGLVEDCDFSEIEGGSGSNANRYNAGWAGGEFSVDGTVINFTPPVWQNNVYSPNAEFRADDDYPFGLSRWQNTYGMS